MFTREGFVAADMSGQSSWSRSTWKADAIRKGNLKISGPIPITEHTPLNEDEEKEFAETGALSPGLPQDELYHQEPRPLTPPSPPPDYPPPPVVQVDEGSLNSHPIDEQVQDVLQPPRQSRSPPRPRQVTEMPRQSVIEPATPSRNGFGTTCDSPAKSAQKKKRKSGLRGVFRKMFGRKGREEEHEEEDVSHRGHSYHHSDPGLLQQSPPRVTKTSAGTRISHLPVKELKPLHPLGQHLPYPMNVNAPPVSPPKEYLTFDIQRPDIGRRRATLPTLPGPGIQRHSLDQPRGRLSAWDEKADEEAAPPPSPGIGIAVTSPPHTTTTTLLKSKRRSRSAGSLRHLVKEHASMDRRRSAEIRYWRQSQASGSTTHSRPHTAKTVETIQSIQRQETMVTEPRDDMAAMSATLAHVDEPSSSSSSPLPAKHRQERQHIEPPESAFNFGLQSGFSNDETVQSQPLAQTTPPAAPTRNRLSIEDRVAHLEGRFQSMESSLKRMSSRTNRQTIILSDAPRKFRSRKRSDSSSQCHFDSLPDYQSSNDTLKSNPASPTLVRPTPTTTTTTTEGNKEPVIEKLYEALKYERNARKALEQQVHHLQHDMSDLHALVNKLIASATATSPLYPTPSPDTLLTVSTTEERSSINTPKAEYGYYYDGGGGGKENTFTRTNSINERHDQQEERATPKEEGFGGASAGYFHHDERRYA
ncbi:hypothetical protein ACEQ8H_002206 [Pleosporales sp. CAS-2024a]